MRFVRIVVRFVAICVGFRLMAFCTGNVAFGGIALGLGFFLASFVMFVVSSISVFGRALWICKDRHAI
jgi:hypothetical protein